MSVHLVNVPGALEPALREALADAPLEVVVAGFGELPTGAFLELEQAEWDAAVAGIRAAFLGARDAAADLLDRGEPGRIVMLSSPPAVRPVHGASLAATAGAFLTTAAQVAAVELADAGLTVNVVVPGWVEGDPACLVAGIPAGRFAEPEEIAAVVAFLASPAAAYVTGAVITVDGGFTITKSGGGSPFLARA